MRKKLVFFLLSLAAFMLLFLAMVTDYPTDAVRPLREVSVVVPYQSSEAFAAIRQGLDQAADDLNVEVRYLTLTKRYDAAEQQQVLARELEGGADGIILWPADSYLLAPQVEAWYRKVPIATIESQVKTQKEIPFIGGDDYKMGISLAERMLAYRQDNTPIYLLYSNAESLSTQERIAGISDTLQEGGLTTFSAILPVEALAMRQELERMAVETPGIWIALDQFILEQAAQLDIPSVPLYGIGSSNLIAAALEEGRIEATVVKNDFSTGYMAMIAVTDGLKLEQSSQIHLVEHRVVDRNNMYDQEIEKLLFPFVR